MSFEKPERLKYVLNEKAEFVLMSLSPLANEFYESSGEKRLRYYTLAKLLVQIDPEFTINVVKSSRKAKYKAPAIIFIDATMRTPIYRDIVEGLVEIAKTFPVKMLLELMMSGTTGRRKKRFIEGVLNEQPIEWHELQVLKNPKAYRRLLRVVHPRPGNDELDAIWRFLTKKGEPPTPRLEAKAKFSEFVRKRAHEKAIELVIEERLPFSMIINNIPRKVILETVAVDDILPLMSSFDVAMYGRLIVDLVGKERATKLIAERGALDYALRAIATLTSDDKELFSTGLTLLARRVRRMMENDIIPSKEEFDVILDFSASMEKFEALTKLYGIAAIESGINPIAFNGCEMRRTVSIYDLLEFEAACSTPLYSAISMSESNNVVVVTDEIENASEVDHIKKDIIVVLNPATYRVHSLRSRLMMPARASAIVEAQRFINVLTNATELIDAFSSSKKVSLVVTSEEEEDDEEEE